MGVGWRNHWNSYRKRGWRAVMQAKDIMTRNVITVPPTMSVRNAALLLRANDISGLPVVDDDGVVCGMLTEGDLMRRVANTWVSILGSTYGVGERRGLSNYVQIHGRSVGEAMSRDVISVRSNAEVGRVAGIMTSHRIKRIPVVDDRRLIGIVSRCDLLNLIIDAPVENIAKGDEALRLAIRTRLATDLGIGHDKVDVVVKDGLVQVQGKLDSDIQRQAIRVLIESVGGAVGYVDRSVISSSSVNNVPDGTK
ncbi:CBS domain-containing protein [Rhizobium sp. WW_1]|uniref:CBS domain-containing protein n=1 Tax=Rhizobium sp. WW_1 TaxID=1907375 RepID=UPI001FE05AB8|nr:CBS domain-containing protein [Rhizobium sp. WW_1]